MIQMGIEYIKETHPLKDTVEWSDINRCFVCCKRKNNQKTAKKQTEEKQGMIAKSGQQIK